MHKLPFLVNFNTQDIIQQLSKANYKLGELNGVIKRLPNPTILLNAILIGEAKDSSAIENILTTYDEIYQELIINHSTTSQAKEVIHYRQAILHGYHLVKKQEFIHTNTLIEIQKMIEKNKAGLRKLPGTVINNMATNQILYTPPQTESQIIEYLNNLETYINDDQIEASDELIKMALIHYQFETIHPFYDGNGRTGRILNVLYLVLKKKIDIPILYISRFIQQNKDQYYALFHQVQRDILHIKDFVLFFLKAIEETSIFTIQFVLDVFKAMEDTSTLMKEKIPKIYSKELVESLYYAFYTKNDHLCQSLQITRNTASKYLNQLVQHGFLMVEKIGKTKIYKNVALFNVMKNW